MLYESDGRTLKTSIGPPPPAFLSESGEAQAVRFELDVVTRLSSCLPRTRKLSQSNKSNAVATESCRPANPFTLVSVGVFGIILVTDAHAVGL